jgi:glycosyltransferase involved in cell wall biosynthesis
MSRVSVLVPTRNRPALLAQALGSVAAQTHPDRDIVVIDDGSTPPVDPAMLRRAAGQSVTLLRNETSLGQASSRERGETAATGDYVFHLDDDDLLAPTLLATGAAVLDDEPDVGIVFFNVQGFGSGGAAFDANQAQALDRVLQQAQGSRVRPGVIVFDESVFPALLRTVPMAFQRPMARRAAWQHVTRLRRLAYGNDHALPPPLRESEWTLYSAATQHVALVTEPLYLQRCEGQGFFSVASQRDAADRALIEVFEHLYALSRTHPALTAWQRDIRRATASCHFDRAYACFHGGSRPGAARHWLRALALQPSAAHVRFGLRMLLPRLATPPPP